MREETPYTSRLVYNDSRLTPPASRLTVILDSIIEKGIMLLLIFTPLAFGTVQQWSISLMEIIAFGILCLRLARASLDPYPAGERGIPRDMTIASSLFLVFAALILLQLAPLPEGLLALLSPSALKTYGELGIDAAAGLHPVSLNPYETAQELLKFLAYASVFYVIISHYRTKEQIQSLARTILYVGGFVAIFAVFQKLTWNGRLYWIYPVESYIRSDAFHIWGPYINHNHFAGYLEMAIPLGLGMLAYAAPGAASLPGVPFARRLARFFASSNLVPFTLVFLLVLAMSATLLASLSRGGIAAFGLSGLYFLWITHKRRSLKMRSGLIAASAFALALLLLFAAWERITERFEDIRQEQDVIRLKIWQESLPMISDFPLLGSGLGSYEQTYMRYQKTRPAILFDHAHNDYLELLTDTGVPGLLLGCGAAALFFSALYRAWRRKHGMFGKCLGAGGLASIVAIAVHSVTDFNLHIPANALLLAVVCGIAYAAVFNVSERNGPPEPEEGPFFPPLAKGGIAGGSPVLRLALFSLFLCLSYFPVRDLVADHYYGRVAAMLDDEMTEGLDLKPLSADSAPEYRAALDSLEMARRLAPANPQYAKALSELHARMGRWAETMEALRAGVPQSVVKKEEAFNRAIEGLEQAVRLQPTNPDFHLALGQLYDTVRGDVRRAEGEFRRAVQAYPASTPLRHALAAHYLNTGRSGDALEQARMLAGLDDSYILPDSPRKTQIIERREDGYRAMLFNSYLFRAIEIAWRASRDAGVVKGIAPDNREAQEVVKLFMEHRGIE